MGSETDTSTVASKVPLQSIHEEEDDFEAQTVSYSRDMIPLPPPNSGSMLSSPIRQRHHSIMVERRSGDEKMR